MYIADLELYPAGKLKYKEVFAVGWLDAHNAFAKGQISGEVLAKLKDILLSKAATLHTHGHHFCNICDSRKAIEIEIQGKQILCGACEIWLPSRGKHIFAAPNMICHYIEAHQYLPPEPFLASVVEFDISSDWNADLAYAAILSKYYGEISIRAIIYAELLKQKLVNIPNPQGAEFCHHPAVQEMWEKINRYKKKF